MPGHMQRLRESLKSDVAPVVDPIEVEAVRQQSMLEIYAATECLACGNVAIMHRLECVNPACAYHRRSAGNQSFGWINYDGQWLTPGETFSWLPGEAPGDRA